MKFWAEYVRAGYEMVLEAQGHSRLYLDNDMEAFLVHVVARTFERTDIWNEPVAIKLMSAQQLPKYQKQSALREVGEECLFINGWQIKQNRWPAPRYFEDMGKLAFGFASVVTTPPDDLLEAASNNFNQASLILRSVRDLYLKNKG